MRRFGPALASAALLLGTAGAVAQQANYPNRPVTLVVPNAAGSSTDNYARFFAGQLSMKLNQPVLVEAIAGGGGTLGVVELLKRPADGYNVMIGTSATHAANYSLFKSLPYTPKDFAPVACLYLLPPVVAIRSTLPLKTVAEVVAYAKENPGKLTYGWSSSSNKIGAELFKARTGADIRGISYRGSQVVNDMLGGRVDMTVEAAVTILPHAESGAMRILAVTAPTRLSSMPDIPTMEEAGFKNAALTPWVGAYVKTGTPPEIIDKLNAAFGDVMASPEYAATEARAKSQAFPCKPAEFAVYTEKEMRNWQEQVELAGIEKQ